MERREKLKTVKVKNIVEEMWNIIKTFCHKKSCRKFKIDTRGLLKKSANLNKGQQKINLNC